MSSAVKRALLVGLAIALAAYLGIAFVMAYQVTQAERVALETSPADFGLHHQDVRFPSRDPDIELAGWYVGATLGAPQVILVHGLSVSREADSALAIARDLHAADFGVLLFDLRAHGESGGIRMSGGDFEQEDLLGAVDWLVAESGAPSVGVLGRSLGAAVAILAAAREPRIQAVVADSPFADVSDLIAQETASTLGVPEWCIPVFIPAMKSQAALFFGIQVGDIVPEAAIGAIDFPVFLIHGALDTRIAPSHTERLCAAAQRQGTTAWLVPGTDHVEAYERAPGRYAREVVSYFNDRLVAEALAPTGT